MESVRKIVVATDKFRDSLSSCEAAAAIRSGLGDRNVLLRPMADGGEGSLDVVKYAFKEAGREFSEINIASVNHRGVAAEIPVLIFDKGKSAFVEMATVCGLNLIPKEKRDLLHSTTYGLGEVIRALIEEKGVRKIILAIGGSGTNDGGFGMLSALGFRYRNTSVFRNKDIATFIGCIEEIFDKAVPTITPHLKEAEFYVACDVSNPLLGMNGATMVYGKQKGGTPDILFQLENALQNWAKVVETYKSEKGLSKIPGTGAAGGVGFAMKAVLGATLLPGWKIFADMLHLEKDIAESDLVITGEGKFDRQSLSGKVISGIGELCLKYGKPLIVVTGKNEISKENLAKSGISRIIEISSAAHKDESPLEDASQIITREIRKLFSNEK